MTSESGINEDDVKKYVTGLSDLHSIPSVMGQILAVVNDADARTGDILGAISHDQSLAEKVVRVANSSFFGHSGEVKDIGQAVMLLGYDRIKSIALGMSVMTTFPARKSFNPVNLWKHSYEVAVLAEAFSQLICMTCPQECFMLGLLHDIGRIILYAMDAGNYCRIQKDDILERERELWGCAHTDAGAWFAVENGMPPEMVSVNRFHHRPSLAKDYRDAVSIVSLAEAMSGRISPCAENDGVWIEEHDILLMEYSLTDDDLLSIGERFCAAKPEIEQFFCRE